MYNRNAGREVDSRQVVMRNFKQVQTDGRTRGSSERPESQVGTFELREVDWKNTKPTVGRTDRQLQTSYWYESVNV